MSYAVIKTGGKQYRVTEGQTLRIEKIDGEPGQDVRFEEVLLSKKGDQLVCDREALKGAAVAAKIVRHGRGTKIRLVRFRRRKGYQKQTGHRQDFTEVRIASIS